MKHQKNYLSTKEKRERPKLDGDVVVNAKRRRLELEQQRQQAIIDEQRKVEEIRQKSKREQENITLKIEFQRQLEGHHRHHSFQGRHLRLWKRVINSQTSYQEDCGQR